MSQFRRANIPWLAAAAICLVHAAVDVAASQIDVVAISGDSSPDGNGAILIAHPPALNDAGQVAFVAGLSGTQGGTADDVVFLRSGGPGLSVIARKGVSTIDGTTITGAGLQFLGIDSDGTVNAVAAMGNPFPLQPFLADDGAIVPFMTVGSPSPSGNNSLTGSSYPPINDQGVGVFRGTYSGANAETGIYVRAADGTLSTRLLQGASSPRGGTITALNPAPTINEAGDVGVRVNIGAGIDPQVAVLRLAESGVVELAREGDTADDGMTTIETIASNQISINDAGQMAFAAEYTQPGARRDGIFLVDEQSIRLVVPGILPQGGTTNNMRVVGLNNAGRVAFYTEFLGIVDAGIYLTGPAGPEVIALEDAALPTGGKFFRSFFSNSIAMNEHGQVVFLAELANSANGPLSGRGLFLHDPQMGLQTILQTGENFEGSTVSELLFTGTHFLLTHSPDTSFDGLNNSGQVAFAFSLANNNRGLAVWSPDIALDGDFNGDGVVDAADYVVWRKNDGSQAGYDLWRTNFGRTAGAASGAAPSSPRLGEPTAAVPEPANVLLPLIASVVGVFRRRAVARSN
ncbi:MAG TPA: choice-of-anchor tandem repeat NxxGxxAF-containing protein [Lacipirellulaceae bacterium]|nr:choice-of-anchor tandem repeat NxxGxxAF-containing protein [Lacipirellulaceae bacterium]